MGFLYEYTLRDSVCMLCYLPRYHTCEQPVSLLCVTGQDTTRCGGASMGR